MLSSSGGGFDSDRAEGCGAAFGEEDAVDAATFGGAEQGAQVLRVFDAVEGENEARLGTFKDVFEIEELPLADDGDDSLVGGGLSHTGEGVAGL
jgi:hypothetical protein